MCPYNHFLMRLPYLFKLSNSVNGLNYLLLRQKKIYDKNLLCY